MILQCELEDKNEDYLHKNDVIMLRIEEMIHTSLIKLRQFFTYKKITLKGSCKCHFCVKIGCEDLENMCKKTLSCLYVVCHEVILLKKESEDDDKSDKIFLSRLKINLIKIIKNIKMIGNKFCLK